MNAEISAFKILNRLDWSSLLLILGLLIGARLLAPAAGWLIAHLADRAPGRWRLTVLKSRPIVRLLIVVGTVLIIIPILVQPTLENAVALLAAFGLVFAFALKDYGSSLVAGLVTVLEGAYQPGDWIQVDGAYGEVRSIGMRAVRIVTSDDTEVIIPHSKVWSHSIGNATGGSHRLLCVADFYLEPHHDALVVRQKLEDVALSSSYRQPDSPVTILVAEKPWGTHYRVKAYVRDSREQFLFTTDLTVRGKATLLAAGVHAARTTPVATDA
jgi:small-conductance mechanosensitive channel